MPLQSITVSGQVTEAGAPAVQARPSAAPPGHRCEESVRVVPGVDLSQGTITFMVDGHLERYWHHEPRLITQALACSVRPVRWFPATRKLTLTVAAAGHRNGVERHFILSAF
ncbi:MULTISPECIES: hypothetical protein [Arthrobacter]|uniref:Uncharacterized protein n=1 Tax=Arthrobacter terricola TaxID=2547396 RepID=A0A4R5KKI9_9MICC|nr:MULTISPECIES: hypothetical protein [Arthrobacter]MBT8161696.1 hypothetical protein [Arthrobacter sp. GN70]TDF95348.1 hypothetical protein E1809_12655 [Arthrobacter terricola]